MVSQARGCNRRSVCSEGDADRVNETVACGAVLCCAVWFVSPVDGPGSGGNPTNPYNPRWPLHGRTNGDDSVVSFACFLWLFPYASLL